jgi:hypothetical protein
VSAEFDASLVCSDPLNEEVLARHREEVEHCATMPSALANAKLHAERELGRLVAACNRLVWGAPSPGSRAPSSDETAALLQRLGPEDRERLLRDSRLASEQRQLLASMEEAETRLVDQLRAEETEMARQEAERLEFAEFEEYDAADKPRRFEAWRASRRVS